MNAGIGEKYNTWDRDSLSLLIKKASLMGGSCV